MSDGIDKEGDQRLERRVGRDERAKPLAGNTRHEILPAPSMTIDKCPPRLLALEHTLAVQSIERRHERRVGGCRKARLQLAHRNRLLDHPQRVEDARFERSKDCFENSDAFSGLWHEVIIPAAAYTWRQVSGNHPTMTDVLEIDTLFLDAGGVLCHPSWPRVSAALAAEGIEISPQALQASEPFAKRDIDEARVVGWTTDSTRGWLYFNKVLEHAGVPLSDATDAALAVLHAYHRTENLWENVPPDVVPALERFRAAGLKLVVVSNANGRLRHLFDRLGLTAYFDVVLDSFEWHVEKPNPRLFEIALEQAQSSAARTAHVGDLFHIDVEGARNAGLREGVLLDAADLYAHTDCRRIRKLDELADVIRLARPLK